ncbi:MAG: STAS/SEC14 domain-containing protein [Erythrobacter sp.]|nr:STAS/SEC14 domain-containing protein [Erythrobacter sp.]
METLAPTAYMSADPKLGEVFFTIAGLWEPERMRAFLRSLLETSYPIIEQERPIHLLGDLNGFVAQTRDTGEVMRENLMEWRDHGLSRVAIFGASTLAKLQYKRLSDGLDVEFFETKISALEWLRRPYAQAA